MSRPISDHEQFATKLQKKTDTAEPVHQANAILALSFIALLASAVLRNCMSAINQKGPFIFDLA